MFGAAIAASELQLHCSEPALRTSYTSAKLLSRRIAIELACGKALLTTIRLSQHVKDDRYGLWRRSRSSCRWWAKMYSLLAMQNAVSAWVSLGKSACLDAAGFPEA